MLIYNRNKDITSITSSNHDLRYISFVSHSPHLLTERLHDGLLEEVTLQVELINGAELVHLVPEVDPALPPLGDHVTVDGE